MDDTHSIPPDVWQDSRLNRFEFFHIWDSVLGLKPWLPTLESTTYLQSIKVVERSCCSQLSRLVLVVQHWCIDCMRSSGLLLLLYCLSQLTVSYKYERLQEIKRVINFCNFFFNRKPTTELTSIKKKKKKKQQTNNNK